jgi:hypothetical protein
VGINKINVEGTLALLFATYRQCMINFRTSVPLLRPAAMQRTYLGNHLPVERKNERRNFVF